MKEVRFSTPLFKFSQFEEVFFHTIVKACKGEQCVSSLLNLN